MRRRFNTTGACSAKRHYMVKLDSRLKQIKEDYVDDGSYFVINRGRQYGKTTTLNALEEYLKDDYLVLSLDFQQLGTEDFADASTFSHAFAEVLIQMIEIGCFENKEAILKPLRVFVDKRDNSLKDLFVCLYGICKCSPRPVVLMIDEVDSASNNQVFIDFLAQLRASYLKRDKMLAFHSVILVGVYSIKNLKLKLRPESEHQYNSPWNIAADFDVDMSFSSAQISEMLEEYERDYHTGMDTDLIAREIYAYTSGYPVLVSMICKRIDEKIAGSGGYETLEKAWSEKGVNHPTA